MEIKNYFFHKKYGSFRHLHTTHSQSAMAAVRTLRQLVSDPSCSGMQFPDNLATGIIDIGDKVLRTPIKVARAINVLHRAHGCTIQLSIKATEDTCSMGGVSTYTLHVLSIYLPNEYDGNIDAVVHRLLADIMQITTSAGFDRFIVHAEGGVNRVALNKCLAEWGAFREIYHGAFECVLRFA